VAATDGLEVDQDGLAGERRSCSASLPVSADVAVSWAAWLYGVSGHPHTASGQRRRHRASVARTPHADSALGKRVTKSSTRTQVGSIEIRAIG
jgi:hypothetical protein